MDPILNLSINNSSLDRENKTERVEANKQVSIPLNEIASSILRST